jgi:hypothetical protein
MMIQLLPLTGKSERNVFYDFSNDKPIVTLIFLAILEGPRWTKTLHHISAPKKSMSF